MESTNMINNLTNHVLSNLLYHLMSSIVMEEVGETTPRKIQCETIQRLWVMQCVPSSHSSLFLTQVTGSGKSVVLEVLRVVSNSVTLFNENILPLSTDQKSKVSRVSDSNDPVRSFHLDSMKLQSEVTLTSTFLKELQLETRALILARVLLECHLKS